MSFSHMISADTPEQADELALFQAEMAGIRPLAQDTVPQARASQPDEAQMARRAAAQQETDLDTDYFAMEAVPLLDPHDPVSFRLDGLQEGVFKKLRLGKYPLEATLDLQGQSLRQARTNLVEFLRDCHRCEIRCLLIRHGEGLQGHPRALLKSYVSHWLTQWPDVLASHSALRAHGGTGALYVLLRKGERQKAHTRERIFKRQPD